MLKNQNKFYLDAKKVLEQNARDGYTVPSARLYPHQWLWDSCFVAIGLRHYDIKKAKAELLSLKRGQWKNGMMPNIIFHSSGMNIDDEFWGTKLNTFAPKDVKTSGITQPPMLVEAVYLVGEKLGVEKRQEFYREMIDCLVHYHYWLYKERDPKNRGLISLIHPYESGMDNSPAWLASIHRLRFPWWLHLIMARNFKSFFNHVRRDVRNADEDQRISLTDTAEYFYIVKKIKQYHYDSKKIIRKTRPVIEDLGFNCILIHANERLKEIADSLDYQLPKFLLKKMQKTEHSMDRLWDRKRQRYSSHNLRSKKLIKQTTVASLLPLYADNITPDRAAELVAQLKDPDSFALRFPVPSVPLNSRHFDADNFWLGPTWVNMNWFLIHGLRKHGFRQEALNLKHHTLQMVEQAGFFEYFSPLDGSGKGAENFSWTAALVIDLLES